MRYNANGDYMKTVLKIIIAALGAIITLNGIALFFVSNVNVGNFLTVVLGSIIMFVALAFKKLAKWLKILLITGICTAIIFSSFLIICGKNDNTTYHEDAIIVLGAAVHGKIPSLTLKRRLDAAAKCLKQNSNPSAVIIVSGGQGNGENITEAEAMKNYLIQSHSISPTKIIKEDKATSTYENFKFSKEILTKKFGDEYTATFITNEYHILRANLCARQAGIEAATHLHSSTTLSYIVSGVLRECLAVIKYLVFKK